MTDREPPTTGLPYASVVVSHPTTGRLSVQTPYVRR